MNDVNSVALVGRLAKDADIKYLQSGTAVVNFNLAVNESVKNGNSWSERASFFDKYFMDDRERVCVGICIRVSRLLLPVHYNNSAGKKTGRQKARLLSLQKQSSLLEAPAMAIRAVW